MNRSSDIFQSEDIIEILRKEMVVSKFGIKSLFLFGSAARNESTDCSDLDFIVIFDGKVTFDRYMDLKIFLEDLFGKKIDLALEDCLKPQLRQRVSAESINVT